MNKYLSFFVIQFGFIKFNDTAEEVWGILDPESDSVASLQGEFAVEPYYDNGFTNTIAGMDLGTEMLTNGDRYYSLVYQLKGSVQCCSLKLTF